MVNKFMKTYEIPLVINGLVTPCYTKATRFIINKHQSILENTSDREKMQKFKELWKLEFDAEYTPSKISFTDKKKMTVFNLKFS